MVLLWRGHGIRVSHEARRAYHGAMDNPLRAGISVALALWAAAGAFSAEEPWAVAGQQGRRPEAGTAGMGYPGCR